MVGTKATTVDDSSSSDVIDDSLIILSVFFVCYCSIDYMICIATCNLCLLIFLTSTLLTLQGIYEPQCTVRFVSISMQDVDFESESGTKRYIS